jgi:LysR family transcriptional regulator, benzoate and cis,cis-muconate-responsive activator of ben and cat genes
MKIGKDRLGAAVYRGGMAGLEVRELRYFQAVAAEGSLSRAAERLGMAQPPLSRAITALERRLGVRLLERDNRGVRLTAAGVVLVEEADRVLDAVSAAEYRTRRAAGGTRALTVTAKPGIAATLLAHIVHAYRSAHSDARAEIVVSGYGEQADLLRTGRVDLALLGSPATEPGLEREPLFEERRVVALPVGHELARRAALSCADLAGLPVPRWPASSRPELDYWAGRDRVPSDGPVTGPVVHDSSQMLEVVALGQAVALVPESLARLTPRPDVAYRPVPDASPYVVSIAWRAGERDRRVAAFVRVAVEATAGPAAVGAAG